MPYGSVLHIPPTNLLLLAAKQEPYKNKNKTKNYLLTKNIEEFSGKKSSGEWASRLKKDQMRAKTNFKQAPIQSAHKSSNQKFPKNHKISPDTNLGLS